MSNRPIYETSENLVSERLVAEALGRAWKCEVVKLPKLWSADYCALRGKQVVSFIEIKSRAYSFDELERFGGYMIDLRKAKELKTLAGFTARPALLVINLKDGMFWLDIAKADLLDVRIGGRTDRNDAADVEPCAFFEMQQFRRITV